MIDKKTTESPKERRMKRERKLRKDIIIREAEKIFIELGYENAKIEEIVFKAGYTKTTFYKYFDSKDDLFAGVLSNILIDMHTSLDLFLKNLGTEYRLRTLGEAFLNFIENNPNKTELINSGKCMTISQQIIEKERQGQNLTESETDYKNNELKLGMLMAEVLNTTLENSGAEGKVDPSRIVFILGALNLVIREIIRRGKVIGQSYDDIRENLTVLFNIIEQGVKNYDEK